MADDNSHGGSEDQPIIIKKKKGHGGHAAHGGAWKVAYADFVTAMMAFFIVMWILGQSEDITASVEYYFNNPQQYSIFTGKRGNVPADLGLSPSDVGKGKSIDEGKGYGDDRAESRGKYKEKHKFTFFSEDNKKATNDNPAAAGEGTAKAILDSMFAVKKVEQAGEKLREYFKQLREQNEEIAEILESVIIEMTDEGLRIELVESKESLFFYVGSDKVRPLAKEILGELASEIGKLPNFVELEGHTDSRQYQKNAVYSNWELSSDRANASRRILESSGMWEGQVTKVTGFADRSLRTPEDPFDPSNRRISILVLNLNMSNFLFDADEPE